MGQVVQRLVFFFLFAASLIGIIPPSQQAISAEAVSFSPDRARFTVKVNQDTIPYHTTGIFVLPGERFTVQAGIPSKSTSSTLRAAGGTAIRLAPNVWQWQAPQKPGLYPLQVSRASSKDTVMLNVFVMVPSLRVQGEWLNGYRIGPYPPQPLRRVARTQTSHPHGFIEVTKKNENTLIAPHFTLKQFLCKQTARYPKYVVLKEQLLWKLEAILEKANRRGYRCTTLHIMSGYRTPHYNRSLGNVKHSRHMWGDAADIFIDSYPQDGKMDDLNRDGIVDMRDALALYELVDGLQRSAPLPRFIGGLAPYRGTSAHGPFVHVDVRGQMVRWNH
jgi:hypothetical protein